MDGPTGGDADRLLHEPRPISRFADLKAGLPRSQIFHSIRSLQRSIPVLIFSQTKILPLITYPF